MNKKWIFFFTFIFTLALVKYIDSKQTNHYVDDWSTFKKQDNSKIVERKTTKQELRRAHVPKSNLRSPSSLRPMRPVRHGRELVGPGSKSYTDDMRKPLTMLNKVSKDWKKKLGNELLRFQEPETRVMVKSEKSFIDVKDGEGRFIEHVIITYIMENGRQNSYRASVDSETGKITQTWGRSIHENIGKQPLRLTPSGSL